LERARATPAATDESFFEFELKDGLDMYGWPIGAVHPVLAGLLISAFFAFRSFCLLKRRSAVTPGTEASSWVLAGRREGVVFQTNSVSVPGETAVSKQPECEKKLKGHRLSTAPIG
jgi:hypothetical protein